LIEDYFWSIADWAYTSSVVFCKFPPVLCKVLDVALHTLVSWMKKSAGIRPFTRNSCQTVVANCILHVRQNGLVNHEASPRLG